MSARITSVVKSPDPLVMKTAMETPSVCRNYRQQSNLVKVKLILPTLNLAKRFFGLATYTYSNLRRHLLLYNFENHFSLNFNLKFRMIHLWHLFCDSLDV